MHRKCNDGGEHDALPLNTPLHVAKCKVYSSPKSVKLLKNGKVLNVNANTIEILELCDGINTLYDIINILRNRYSDDNISNKIHTAINRLLSNGIVTAGVHQNSESLRWLHGYTNRILAGEYTPQSVSIELTDYCNIECSFCYRDANTSSYTHMKEPIKILRELAYSGVGWVELTGGEPLTHPKFDDILSFTLDEFEYVGLLTNGTLLTDSILSKLGEYKNKVMLQISLPTLNENRYRMINNSRMHSNVINAIKLAIKHDLKLRIAVLMIDEYSIKEFPDIVKYLDKIGVRKVYPGTVIDYGRGKSISQIDDEIAKHYSDMLSRIKDKYDIIGNELETMGDKINERVNCGAGSARYAYSPTGLIRPCTLFPTSFSRSTTFSRKLSEEMRKLSEPGGDICVGCDSELYCKNCMFKGWLKFKEKGDTCSWAVKNNVGEIFSHWQKQDEP